MPPVLPVGSDPPVLLLYPLRLVHPVTGRWARARYRAEREVIEQRYAKWEITGEPEVRRVEGGGFSPWR
jgi:hypothetical protein